MRTKLTILLLMIMILSLSTEFLHFGIPAASPSSNSAFSSSVSTLGTTIPANVEATQNFGANISISRSINMSGNDVIRLAGLSPLLRAKVYLNGSIEVRENATLVLQYVTLYFTGGKKDYDRYIRLSDPSSGGHPRLVVLNATLITTSKSGFSLAGAIHACGNSEITGKEFAFYRERPSLAKTAKTNVLNCSDQSFVDLSFCVLESVSTYGDARVSISSGRSSLSRLSWGVPFEVRNSSSVSIYGMAFGDTLVVDNAQMSLSHCKQMAANLKTKNFANVTISAGSELSGSIARFSINATDNSRVTVDTSKLTAAYKEWNVVAVKDNAVLSLYNSTLSGNFMTLGNSTMTFHDMRKIGALEQAIIESHDSSYISILNCLITPMNFAPELLAHDSSHISFVDSKIDSGWINFFDSTSAYFSNSTLFNSQIFAFSEANVTLVNGCTVGNALQMRNSSKLYVESSSLMVLFSLDTAQIFLINSSISMIYSKDDSKIMAVNSTIKELLYAAANVSGSWTRLTNFFENMSFTLVGRAPDTTLINTYVNALDVLLSGNSNVTISNSTLRNIGVQGSSVVKLYNVSVALEAIFALGNAKVFIWSTLSVRTVDYFGSPLSGANATIYAGATTTGTQITSRLTDEGGWADFLLFSVMVNATGRFTVGDITVQGKFGGVSSARAASLAATNEDVSVALPLPSWSRYILPLVVLVAMIAILFVASFVYKKIRRTEE